MKLNFSGFFIVAFKHHKIHALEGRGNIFYNFVNEAG